MHSIILYELPFSTILGNNCARDRQEAVVTCYCFLSIVKSKLVSKEGNSVFDAFFWNGFVMVAGMLLMNTTQRGPDNCRSH